MIKRGIALLAAVAALQAAGPQQENCVAWCSSWEDAKNEAEERNVPIFFTIQQDENPGSKQMEGAFRDGSFITASRRVACVVANPDTKHGIREVMVNRQKVPFCKAYDGITCDVHTRCQSALGKFFKIGADFGIPSQVWARANGEELFKTTRDQGAVQSVADLIKDMDRALDRISGPMMPRRDWEEMRKLLRDGSEAQGRLEYKTAMLCFKKVMECKYEKFAQIGKSNYDSHIASLVNVVGRAVKAFHKYGKDTKEHKEVKPLLQKIAKEMKGTEAGDAAEKALKELK